MQSGGALACVGWLHLRGGPGVDIVVADPDEFHFLCNFLPFFIHFLSALPLILMSGECTHRDMITVVFDQPRHQLRRMHIFFPLNVDALPYRSVDLS